MGLLSEAKSPFLEALRAARARRLAAAERPTDVLPQADGDSGRVTDEEWDELLRREYRRALLEDFHV